MPAGSELPDRERLDPIESALRKGGSAVVRISGATGEGLPGLLREILRALESVQTPVGEEAGSAAP